jgi:hypothetical protein
MTAVWSGIKYENAEAVGHENRIRGFHQGGM